jgi:hypothetical protein
VWHLIEINDGDSISLPESLYCIEYTAKGAVSNTTWKGTDYFASGLDYNAGPDGKKVREHVITLTAK